MVCPTDSGRQLALAHQIVRLKANIRKYLRKKLLNATKKNCRQLIKEKKTNRHTKEKDIHKKSTKSSLKKKELRAEHKSVARQYKLVSLGVL